jgi:transcriptional regulator with XRE-family HTH domain
MNTWGEMDIAALGDRIATRREELRLDQDDVAELAGLSRAYISRLERGIVPNPKVCDLAAVARALEMTLGAMLTPDQSEIVRVSLSHDWDEFRKQIETWPADFQAIAIRSFRESAAAMQAASELVHRN